MDSYIEKEKGTGAEVMRWKTDRKYSKEERKAQWDEAEKHVKEGKPICLSDLMINGGM